MMKSGTTILLVGGLVLAGCAQKPDTISAQSVSDVPYMDLSCSKLAEEQQRVNARLEDITAQQTAQANSDAGWIASGVIFIPMAIFAAGGPDYSDEIGRLKGESQAMDRASTAKNC